VRLISQIATCYNSYMRSGPPDKLTDRHRHMLYLAAAGERSSDIAKTVGLSPQRTSTIINSQLFRQELERLRSLIESKVRLRLYTEAAAAIENLAQLRDKASEERVQLSASRTLLERVRILEHAPTCQNGQNDTDCK
jgi:hypothetical protein